MNKILIAGIRISASALAKKIAEDNPNIEVHLFGANIEGDIPQNLIYLEEITIAHFLFLKIKEIHQDYDFIYAADFALQFNVQFQEWKNTVSIPILCPLRECCFLEYSKLHFKKILNELSIPNPHHQVIIEDEWGHLPDLDKDRFSSGKFLLKLDKSHTSTGIQTRITDLNNYKKDIYLYRHLGPVYFAEEFINGKEFSAHFLCNGEDFIYLGSARDYKKMYEGDAGQNCSSTGCYSPVEYITDDIKLQTFSYVYKILKYLKEKGFAYQGIMYLGMIIDDNNIAHILELNSRPGNPEFNTLINLISSKNLLKNLYNAALGKPLEPVEFNSLTSVSINIINSEYALYAKVPESLPELSKNKEITTCYFHKGVYRGGLFANILHTSSSLQTATDKLYNYIEQNDLKNYRVRKDIGRLL